MQDHGNIFSCRWRIKPAKHPGPASEYPSKRNVQRVEGSPHGFDFSDARRMCQWIRDAGFQTLLLRLGKVAVPHLGLMNPSWLSHVFVPSERLHFHQNHRARRGGLNVQTGANQNTPVKSESHSSGLKIPTKIPEIPSDGRHK